MKVMAPSFGPEYNTVLKRTVEREGGWRLWSDPKDPGGRTFAGLSERWTNPKSGANFAVDLVPGGEALWKAIDLALESHQMVITDYREVWDGTKPPYPVEAAARDVFRLNYWNPLKLDKLPAQFRIREVLFDAGVHLGPGLPAQWFQKALGMKEDDIDGKIGTQTIGFALQRTEEADYDAIAEEVTRSRLSYYESEDRGGYLTGFKNRARKVLRDATDQDEADRGPSGSTGEEA